MLGGGGSSTGSDSTVKFKVVRQPFLVERLVVKELSGRDNAAFALIYLSEFRTAVGAFILQASDAKGCKVLLEFHCETLTTFVCEL